MKKYLLEVTVFVCGAAVMTIEMVGSRILAPYLGTSIFVWTSLIGVILGCLSLGYWVGGRVADRKPDHRALSLIILLSGIFVGLVSLFKEPLLFNLQTARFDLRLTASLATFILLGPPGFLLGMVLPFSAKLKINSLDRSGSTVGALYAVSTVGSIVGTFLAGFFLISFLGNTLILLLTAFFLVLIASLLNFTTVRAVKVPSLVVLAAMFFSVSSRPARTGFVDVDTDYNRVWIIDGFDPKVNLPVRMMQINNESSSAVYIGSDEPVYDYIKFYRLAEHFLVDLKSVLMIGGGAYTYPRDFLSRNPNARMDVVEIDPELTALSKKYFGLRDSPRLTVFHEDGRAFLNQSRQKYDAIFVDAFRSVTVPHHLATREATQKVYNSLTGRGIVLVNIISSIEGEEGKFLRAELRTYKSVFPQVYVFPVQFPESGRSVQNIILVALKSKAPVDLSSTDPQLSGYLKNLWRREITTDVPILTDDLAPVEHYRMAIEKNPR